MSRQYSAQNEDPREVVTLSVDGSGSVVVPDSALLFSGTFNRVGSDLYIDNDGAPSFRLPGYFENPHPADLFDPAGAVLRGSVVDLLAGPLAPGQYVQVGGGGIGQGPIGQVETVEGITTVQRVDGTVETLQVGMKIFQNDVIATEDAASVAVTFVDGTIFTLASASRMVIDELIFDPAADDNSGSFSLIQGSFVFIAGQVAKTGGMDVNTPSSTMGIRGTTVVVQVGTVNGVDTTEVTLTTDPDGGQGRVELRDNEGNLIAFIDEINTKWVVSGANNESREIERTLQDETEDSALIAEAFAAFRAATSRVDAGDTFVSLSDPVDRGAGNDPGTNAPTDLDVDEIDESESIEAPPDVENEPADDPGSFDEGLIIDDSEPPPVIVVTGFEDASEETAIAGEITVAAGAPGDLVYALNSGPSNGVVSVAPDGQFDYVPVPNFNGSDSFTFVVTDPAGDSIEGIVIVQVLPVNDAPTASDGAVSVTEDNIVTGMITASDIDGDNLSYAISAVPANGEVVLLQNGIYAYTPNLNYAGADSFSVRVSDPSGETAEATVTVTVTGTNDAPVITTVSGQDRGVVVEGEEEADAAGQLSATDPDDGAVVTWSGVSAAVFGTFVITSEGAWSYVLDNSIADGIAEGETVTETLTATASDQFGAEVTQVVEVTLTGTNDAPVVATNSVFQVDQNGVLSDQLTAADADSTAPLTFALGSDGPDNGTVTINSDGSFVYTPNAGFAGLDRFEYTVEDSAGGITSGRATAAVEAPTGSVGARGVTIALTTVATEETAAGALSIDAESVTAQSVNLVIAMDSSGSIGQADWAEMRDAVNDAVGLLADQFEGSTTNVDVQIITYSGGVSTFGPYDLQDPTLSGAISTLPYRGGATRWDLAFTETASFLNSQPENEANFLLFITDGVPSNGSWRDALAELNNPPGGGYTVDIQAFGFGTGYDPTLLEEFDPDPTFLVSPAELAAALTQTPVFDPRLISLELTLDADGEDKGIIADETSSALSVDGIDYALPLASIENIEMLLGEDNLIGVTARFDLDGDESTAEIELFTSDVIGKAESAQTLTGFAQADLLFGSDAADVIDGGGGNDVIFGFGGDDTINGGAGADIVLAGAGDDVIAVTEAPDSGTDVVDGGAGRDILAFDLAGNLTEDVLPTLDIRDIEALDMQNGQANTLELSLSDVVDLSTTGDSLLETLLDEALPESAVIYGDAGDQLTLVTDGPGSFQKVSDTPVDDGQGNSLDIYAYVDGGNVLATLGVDTDIDVVGAAPVI
ncbi:tandem-95 repeat protein [Roseobacter sp. YSTF-M11]|uniref:Tandem-95 repeat protein n=1 Tax=Roseobacter insulae TaxID=2859783 RepID=A0A9X1FYS8_9RHOB|nr:Ig-like domain-containing protein [Roseobacter insulae]MBW4710675.1 tandem-95 repeat protein [Roseobacter insulae]